MGETGRHMLNIRSTTCKHMCNSQAGGGRHARVRICNITNITTSTQQYRKHWGTGALKTELSGTRHNPELLEPHPFQSLPAETSPKPHILASKADNSEGKEPPTAPRLAAVSIL